MYGGTKVYPPGTGVRILNPGKGGGGGAPPVEPPEDPLTVAIASPTAGASLTQGEEITISGTVSRTGAVVTVEGLAATVVGTNWTRTFTPGTVGALELNAVATEGGDEATDAVSVTVVAGAGASVALTSHTGGETLDVATQYTFSGTCSDCDSVRVEFNGQVLGTDSAVLGGGTWTINATPLHTVAAFDGTLKAIGTPSGGGADVESTAATVTVYSPLLETDAAAGHEIVLWKCPRQASSITVAGGTPNTVTSETNLATGVAWNTAAVANFPEYGATSINGRPAKVYDGATSARGLLTTTDTAAINALVGDDPAFTYIVVYAPTSVNATRYWLSWSTAAHASNNTASFGQHTTGGGCLVYSRIDNAAVSGVWDGILTVDTTPKIAEIYSPGGGVVYWRLNGGVEASETIATLGVATPTRIIDGMRLGASTAFGHFSGAKSDEILAKGLLPAEKLTRIRGFLQRGFGIALAGLIAAVGLSVVANDAYATTSANVIQFRTSAWSYTEGGVQKQATCYADTLDRYRLKTRTYGVDTWTTCTKIPFTVIHSDDPHNVCLIAVDGSGYFHCVASRHGEPMAWTRSANPYDPESLSELGIATNILPGVPSGVQNKVTYVEAAQFSNGDLLFAWRNGSSGNGNTHLARLNHVTQTWTDLGMIVNGTVSSPNTSAYIHELHIDALDRIHLAWEWRLSPSTPSNVEDVCYMVSQANPLNASATWYREPSLTTPITLPVLYNASPPAVLDVAANSGLRESGGTATDPSGNPAVCTFRCFTPGGSAGTTHDSEYFLLVWNGTTWVESVVGGITADFHYPNATTGGPWMVPPKLFYANGKWHVVVGTYPQLDGIFVNSIAADLSGGWSGWTALYPHSFGAFGNDYGGTVGRACVNYDRSRWKNHGVLSCYVQRSIQCGMLELTLPA